MKLFPAAAAMAVLFLVTCPAHSGLRRVEKGDFHVALNSYLAEEQKKGVELAPVYETCDMMEGDERNLCLENVFVQLLKKRLAAQGEAVKKLYEVDPAKAPFERLTEAGRAFARKMMAKESAELQHQGSGQQVSIDQLMKEYPAIQACLDAIRAAKGPSGPLNAKRALTVVVARCGADDKACRDASVEKWSAANCPKGQ